MNPRTQEFVKQFATNLLNRSGYDMREYEPFLEESEKLVELIVTKCAVIATRCESNGTKNIGAEILEHFGVE